MNEPILSGYANLDQLCRTYIEGAKKARSHNLNGLVFLICMCAIWIRAIPVEYTLYSLPVIAIYIYLWKFKGYASSSEAVQLKDKIVDLIVMRAKELLRPKIGDLVDNGDQFRKKIIYSLEWGDYLSIILKSTDKSDVERQNTYARLVDHVYSNFYQGVEPNHANSTQAEEVKACGLPVKDSAQSTTPNDGLTDRSRHDLGAKYLTNLKTAIGLLCVLAVVIAITSNPRNLMDNNQIVSLDMWNNRESIYVNQGIIVPESSVQPYRFWANIYNVSIVGLFGVTLWGAFSAIQWARFHNKKECSDCKMAISINAKICPYCRNGLR